MQYEKPAIDAMNKLHEFSSQRIEEVKTAVVSPVTAPVGEKTSSASESDAVTVSPDAAQAASPPASQLREPSVGQVAAVGDRDWEKILENVIDVSKIPKRKD